MNDSPITVVFLDADNTLWDTDGVYEQAQLALLTHVEDRLKTRLHDPDRLGFVRSIDQALAERHHAGLRYPHRFLVKALALALTGTEMMDAVRLAWSGGAESGRLTDDAVSRIEGQIVDDLQRSPALRPGVESGLSRLSVLKFPKIVLTENKLDRVWGLIRSHELEIYIDRVLEIRKDQQSYRRLVRLFHPSNAGFMIGDQLERDVRPAKAAGLHTILYPSKFRPKWEHQHDPVAPEFQVNCFDEVPAIVENVLALAR